MVIVTRPRDVTDPFYRSTSRDYTRAYHSIVQAARGGHASSSSHSPSPVLLLVSTDVDAICAARILVSLLTDDDVPYKMCPVDGYSTLTRIIEEDVESNPGLHTVVLLNMGSILSLPDFFTSASDPMPGAHVLPDHCHIHLVDSHRPYNLDNLFATSRINDRLQVWDDGEVEERLGREEKAYSALEFLDEEESSEEEESEEEDESQGEEGEEGQRHRKRARSSKQGKKRLPPNIIAGHRKVMTRYYNRGAQYGMSVAGMMFLLGERLGRGGNESLWMAILGLTSQYMSSQVPHGLYNDLSKALAADVMALNPPMDGKLAYGADEGRIRVIKKELRFTLYRHWSLEASMYHSSYVAGKMGVWQEKGLVKLRSFMAKMGMSLSQCRQAFEHMDLNFRNSLVDRIEAIAPEYELTECVYQSFIRSFGFRCPAMSAADTVEGLEALLCAAHGVRVEIDAPGLAFNGSASGIGDASSAYLAAMGGQTQGSDMFNAKKLWSLTKNGGSSNGSRVPSPAAAPGKENRGPAEQTHGASGDVTKDAEGRDQAQDIEEGEEAFWVQNFFAAFNALEVKKPENLNMLRASLSLSKSLHDIIVRQGVSIIDKQMIRTLRNFRLVILKDGNDLKLFHNTQVLTKLGFWLVDALRDLVMLKYQQHRQQGKKPIRAGKRNNGEDNDDALEDLNSSKAGPNNLPFIIAALNERDDTYSIVGINASMHYGDVLRNEFGFRFHQAIQESNCRSKHDKFETSAVEIRSEDFSTFIESLHSIL